MAEGKKSFTAYCDWNDVISDLTDEEAGRLSKMIFAYVNDKNPTAPDRLTELLFKPIKSTLKRDLQKWIQKSEVNRLNGKKGGRPKGSETNPEKANGYLEKRANPEKPVTDTVSVSDSVTVKDKEKVKVTLEDRMVDFQKKILPHISENFTREDANDFYRYWTEMNEGGYKMRFEKEKTWNIKSRIVTWVKNKKVARKNKDDGRISAKDYFNNLRSGTGLPQNENKFIE